MSDATSDLRSRARAAVADDHLRGALRSFTDRLAAGRIEAQSSVENYEELREAARSIKAGVLDRLPETLDRLASIVEARGGRVFWAADAQEANAYVRSVAAANAVKLVVKSKSMVTEEIHLNAALESDGMEVVETDLGEWIIQLAHETPSHILAPAIHKTRGDIAALFNRVAGGDLSDVPAELCVFARSQLRDKFLAADMGVSGVNFGIAETGSIVLFTNEGNGRMVTSLPRVHVAVMGMERVLETWEQFDVFLTLLPRAASGQHISTYLSAITGPRLPPEVDGPDEFHLVVVDNGRSRILATEFREILHCIRCGACLNVCPVYRQMGGHGYGAVYSGPIGAVLTPLMKPGSEAAVELSGASSLCGACWDACPVKIPIHDLLLGLRSERAESASTLRERRAWSAWARAWSSPIAYRASTAAMAMGARRLPEAAFPSAWTDGRMPPRPEGGGTFRSRFKKGI